MNELLLEKLHVLRKHIGHKILTFGFVVSFRYESKEKQKSDPAELQSVAVKLEGFDFSETEKMGQHAELEKSALAETETITLKMELSTELEKTGHPELERKPKM